MRLDDWFLLAHERENSQTKIDASRSCDIAWTEGNSVEFLVHGATYFARLASVISVLGTGDEVRFTDWRGDGDERMADDLPTIASLIAALCGRGADVRGLLWRSHSDRIAFSKKENRTLARESTSAGGEVLLDERVRRGGSHHQKLVVVRRTASPEDDVAFIGGVDLSHGRRDSIHHRGDPQSIKIDARYGANPPWHDIQLEVKGPAVTDLDFTFRERWEDPTPLNHSGVSRAWLSRAASRDKVAEPLPSKLPDPPSLGSSAVQVLRTYPRRRPPYPFAPEGERSIARGFAKAIARARTLIYIEDQYLWSFEIAELLARSLRQNRSMQLICVVPRYPDKDGRLSGPVARLAQGRFIALLQAAGGDRVGIYDLENDDGTPIYVHAKVCIIDDVWAAVGSDNLNRRSWTHDSEVCCAVIDSELDHRSPLDPSGLGDGSRRFARNLRLSLWAEHLGRSPDDPALLRIEESAALWRQIAGDGEPRELRQQVGSLSPSRARSHEIESVAAESHGWAQLAYRLVLDPDGRPRHLRRSHLF
jgi:phosphatidylserine/phosphatidylglycerophosphate/cardiolipin synthase-like enzyme